MMNMTLFMVFALSKPFDNVPPKLKDDFDKFVASVHSQHNQQVDNHKPPLLGASAGGHDDGDGDAIVAGADVGNATMDPYSMYLLMVCFIRSGHAYMMVLQVFAMFSILINITVAVTLLYQVRLKLRTRHIIFLNLCLTEMLSAVWEVFKDELLMRIELSSLESYILIIPAVILQSAASLTVVMMVALGIDTYFAIKQPFRYLRICGRGKKVGFLVVSVSWLIALFIWMSFDCLENVFSRDFGFNAITVINLSGEVGAFIFMSAILIVAAAMQFRVFLQVRSTVATPEDPQLRRNSCSILMQAKNKKMSHLTRKSFFFSMLTILLAVMFWLPYTVYRIVVSVEIITSNLFDFEYHMAAFQILHIIYCLDTFLTPALYAFRMENPITSLVAMVKEIHQKLWGIDSPPPYRTRSFDDHHQKDLVGGAVKRRPKRSGAIIAKGDLATQTKRRTRTKSEPIIVGCETCGSIFTVSTTPPSPPPYPKKQINISSRQRRLSGPAAGGSYNDANIDTLSLLKETRTDSVSSNTSNNSNSSACGNHCHIPRRHSFVAKSLSLTSESTYIDPWAEGFADDIEDIFNI